MPEYADIKFNNGNGALLCNSCRVVIATGHKHEDKYHYCDDCRANSEHGFCSECDFCFDKDYIWQTGKDLFNYTDEEADRYAECYGATRTKGKFSSRIAISSWETDRVDSWMCPKCEHTVEREW